MSSVLALGKTVVSLRKDGDKGDLRAVHIPDHLDILAQHPSGAHVHFLFSSVLGMRPAKIAAYATCLSFKNAGLVEK